MKTNRVSFNPELITLGKYMLQGLVGGIFAALALMLFYLIRGLNVASFFVVIWAVVPMVVGGVIGVIKAIPFWALNHFLRSPLPPLARVIVGGFVPTSLWLFFLIREGEANKEVVVISSCVVFLLSLPTSLLIGSRVRPERFFTAGSNVFLKNGIYKRLSVTDPSLVLGRLPLRLLSTGALLFYVLAVACWQLLGEDVQQDIMFRYFPLLYFSLSVYLTFRTPRKTILIILALTLSVPLLLAIYFSTNFCEDYGWGTDEYLTLLIIPTMLLAAWTIFVGTQLSVSLSTGQRAILSDKRPAIDGKPDHDHQCLGSRFTEWQQRAA
jgi:hypothetical protein